MTEDQITALCESMLRDWGLDRWIIRWEDTLPSFQGNLAGHCSWDERVIRLSREYVLDYESSDVVAILQHEIAHARTPEEKFHGPRFDWNLREMRSGCAT
jgi:SprT-like family.